MELHYLAKDPFQQFHDWFKEAELKAGTRYPNAMSLATVSKDGMPSIRVVLLKGFSHDGFTFFTNYESHKGKDLDENPKASLCFFWDSMRRQVRASGLVKKISKEESQIYFSSRPRSSQIGAWASPQSQEIPSRQFLEKSFLDFEKKFHGIETIPVPDHWGGYTLCPQTMEFWQEQENRLHDRFLYSKSKEETWAVKRLAP